MSFASVSLHRLPALLPHRQLETAETSARVDVLLCPLPVLTSYPSLQWMPSAGAAGT